MKKFFFLIASILFLVQFSKAQTEKGSQTLGMNLGFMYQKSNNFSVDTYDNSTSTQNNNFTQFNIGPAYSYFIADKLDIGTSLSYSYDVTNYSGINVSESKNTIKNYGGGLFLRKYFMYKDKIGFRTGPFVSYSKQDQHITYSQPNSLNNLHTNSNNYDAGVNLELVYYPTKHVGVSATLANLSYQHLNYNSGSQGNGKDDFVNFSFINQGLYLSVYYTFGG